MATETAPRLVSRPPSEPSDDSEVVLLLAQLEGRLGARRDGRTRRKTTVAASLREKVLTVLDDDGQKILVYVTAEGTVTRNLPESAAMKDDVDRGSSRAPDLSDGEVEDEHDMDARTALLLSDDETDRMNGLLSSEDEEDEEEIEDEFLTSPVPGSRKRKTRAITTVEDANWEPQDDSSEESDADNEDEDVFTSDDDEEVEEPEEEELDSDAEDDNNDYDDDPDYEFASASEEEEDGRSASDSDQPSSASPRKRARH